MLFKNMAIIKAKISFLSLLFLSLISKNLNENKSFIIKPDGFDIPYESENIHGISTDLALAEGHDLINVLESFNAAISKSKFIVGHNINFDLKLFDKLVKLSFQQRRKKIKNSLKKLDIKENILEDSIFGLRPEQLSVNDFIRLTKKISNETI